jgi:hypothetical protein
MLVDLALNVSMNTKILFAIFLVFILTPIDEDNVPLNGGLNGLTQTKCTSFTSAPRGNEAEVSNLVQCCSSLAIT